MKNHTLILLLTGGLMIAVGSSIGVMLYKKNEATTAAAAAIDYSQAVKKWLAIQLSSNNPVKVDQISINEISRGERAFVLSYNANVTLTEDLYKVVSPAIQSNAKDELNGLHDALDKKTATPETIKYYSKAFDSLQSLPNAPLLQIESHQGEHYTISGKARAVLTDDGSWDFTLLSEPSGDYTGNTAPNGKYFIDGSPEANSCLNLINELVTNVKESIKKDADIEKNAQDAFLLNCVQGKQLIGTWHINELKGDIGIRFDKVNKNMHYELGVSINDTYYYQYSIEGVLFDPENPSHEKPFSGNEYWDPENKSFGLNIITLALKGEFNPHPIKDVYGNVLTCDDLMLKREGIFNTTASFLLKQSGYSIVINYLHDGIFSGKTDASQDIDLCIDNHRDISFQFKSTSFSHINKAIPTEPHIVPPNSNGADRAVPNQNQHAINQQVPVITPISQKTAIEPDSMLTPDSPAESATIATGFGVLPFTQSPASIGLPFKSHIPLLSEPSITERAKFPKNVIRQGVAGDFFTSGGVTPSGLILVAREDRSYGNGFTRKFIITTRSSGHPRNSYFPPMRKRLVQIPRDKPLIFVSHDEIMGEHSVQNASSTEAPVSNRNSPKEAI